MCQVRQRENSQPLAAASCGQIPTQNFKGSHDLKVQPERDARSLGPTVVLGRELVSPPGHCPCKHNQRGGKGYSEQRGELRDQKAISSARHYGASKRFFKCNISPSL